jgi:hypothetical protein
MAFGKKKEDERVADAAAAVEAEAADDESAPLDEEDVAAAPAPTADPAPAAAASSDALLSMFQTTREEANDLSILVDLAGDSDLDDILEELRTLRAALGITDTYDDEDLDEDLAAAA